MYMFIGHYCCIELELSFIYEVELNCICYVTMCLHTLGNTSLKCLNRYGCIKEYGSTHQELLLLHIINIYC